jgi:hypothetical protein
LDDYALSHIVTKYLFPRVKFLDKKLDLEYSEQKNSVSCFVFGRLPMRKDFNLETYWNEIKKFISDCITKSRSEKTTALRNAFHGEC